MTRYSNLARPKRTFVEAGFNDSDPQAGSATQTEEPSAEGITAVTKKWKRVRSKKTKFADSDGAVEDNDDCVKDEGTSERLSLSKKARLGDNIHEDQGKMFVKHQPKDANARNFASGQRRMKRIEDRKSDTICFACRERGHAARDCTNSLAADSLDGKQRKSAVKSGRDAVGICYRCGSRRHTLLRCKEPVDPSNSLPFASCFVCSGKGHLASKCPKNQSRGIYPNGGCCKLCKENTHLAKDCPLRKQEVAANTLFVGTGQEGGADEDDFHTFKRKTAEVDKSEKTKRKVGLQIGTHTGIVKAFGNGQAPKKKKVVFF